MMILGYIEKPLDQFARILPRDRSGAVRVSRDSDRNNWFVNQAVEDGLVKVGGVVFFAHKITSDSWAAGTHDGIRDGAGSRTIHAQVWATTAEDLTGELK